MALLAAIVAAGDAAPAPALQLNGGAELELIGRALFGPAESVATDGVHTFIGADSAVLVLDAEQTLLGSLYTPGMVRGIALSGSHLYVADEDAGLRLIDAADPE